MTGFQAFLFSSLLLYWVVALYNYDLESPLETNYQAAGYLYVGKRFGPLLSYQEHGFVKFRFQTGGTMQSTFNLKVVVACVPFSLLNHN